VTTAIDDFSVDIFPQTIAESGIQTPLFFQPGRESDPD
jgi:hypothetical protein